MVARTMALLAVLPLLGNTPTAQKALPVVRVGDHLTLEMSGELARAYVRSCSDAGAAHLDADGLQVSTTAVVAQQLDGGRIRIEHYSHVIPRDDHPPRLVTLTGTVDSASVAWVVTPRGTPVYSSPSDLGNGKTPVLTAEETKTPRLQLSDLKELKLRTWTLESEAGDSQ